jgi:hypothetical protein
MSPSIDMSAPFKTQGTGRATFADRELCDGGFLSAPRRRVRGRYQSALGATYALAFAADLLLGRLCIRRIRKGFGSVTSHSVSSGFLGIGRRATPDADDPILALTLPSGPAGTPVSSNDLLRLLIERMSPSVGPRTTIVRRSSCRSPFASDAETPLDAHR